jgi:hypothetical protein
VANGAFVFFIKKNKKGRPPDPDPVTMSFFEGGKGNEKAGVLSGRVLLSVKWVVFTT